MLSFMATTILSLATFLEVKVTKRQFRYRIYIEQIECGSVSYNYVLIYNNMHHHSGQNVVDTRCSHDINVKKLFLRAEKRDCICMTHWCEQRGVDSYPRQQISQSDCGISSNCGKNGVYPLQTIYDVFGPLHQNNLLHYWIYIMF